MIWLSLFDYRWSREVGLFSFPEVILEQVIGGKKDETSFILRGFKKRSGGL